MLYYIEVSNDITKLKQYDHIEKNQSSQIFISEMELIMDLTLQKLKLFLTIKPTNLRLIKYVVAKQLTSIIFMTIYLKEKDLQLFILRIKNKSEDIGGYTIKIIRKNNKDFIQKEIYFNKSRLVSKIKKKKDDKNMIFFKYCDKIYPFKLEITAPYIAKFSDATDK